MSVPAEEMKKQTVEQVDEIKPVSGIVNNVSQQADQYKAPEVKPITTEVDAGQETVESRLDKLTTSGNPSLELQKNEASREANTRGLVNSTMAVGAGRDAFIRNALPIAQQDAKTYTDTRMNNQSIENKFLTNRQSANLNKETAGYQSQLNKEENTLLNDLTIKRDKNLSALTQEEQAQLNDLEIKKAGEQSQFDINRDNNSASLNEGLAAFESELKMNEMELDSQLKIDFEKTLNDVRFSDEMKLQVVSTMNNIIRDSNQQIVDIGTSDRTAEQQAAAIDLLKKERNAELAVYQDLLSGFNSWEWGTNFTPGSTTSAAEDANYWNAPNNAKPVSEPKIGDNIGGKIYQGNGVWEAPSQNNNWSDY